MVTLHHGSCSISSDWMHPASVDDQGTWPGVRQSDWIQVVQDLHEMLPMPLHHAQSGAVYFSGGIRVPGLDSGRVMGSRL